MTNHFYAESPFSATEVLNSDFHREMIAIAFPGRRGISRRWRMRGMDRFHLKKMLFFAKQKYFYSRVINYFNYRREVQKEVRVKYLPPSVQMESSTGCALKCPGCLVGTQNARGRMVEVKKTSLDLFVKTIDAVYKKCFQMYFHMHAEPLLNETFFEACRYAAQKGLWTGIHTNLIPHITDLPEKILKSKLCNLVVSLDGATNETYEKYRVGGNLNMVLRKMEQIADLKRKFNSSFPWITAKFLVFEHNWHEIKSFKERALAHGANEVIYVSGFANGIYRSHEACTEFEFNLDQLKWEKAVLPSKCPFIWDDLRIDFDGGLFPCGNGYANEHKFFRNENEDDPTSILLQFNSEKFLQMRSFFLDKPVNRSMSFPEPCSRCGIVKNYISK